MALRGAEETLPVARLGGGAGVPGRPPVGSARLRLTASHSPRPAVARGEVAAPVEGSRAVRAPQRVLAVPAHATPRARRQALQGVQQGDPGS